MEAEGWTTARDAFFKATSKLYKGMIKQVRDRALDRLDKGDLVDCLEEGQPNYIRPTIWENSYVITHRYRESCPGRKTRIG